MRRQFGCALFLGTLVAPLPAAGQAPDTVRFAASGIAVALVLLDRGATSHRDEGERVLRAGLDELEGWEPRGARPP